MQYNKVEISGVNTSTLRVLTENEKQELLRRTACGDKNAREELIKGNLRLVLSVLQRFSSGKESPDDLFQVGVVGLIKAIDNFDVGLNVKFSTYAVPTALGSRKSQRVYYIYIFTVKYYPVDAGVQRTLTFGKRHCVPQTAQVIECFSSVLKFACR